MPAARSGSLASAGRRVDALPTGRFDGGEGSGVTREAVWQSVSDSLRKDFGRMLDVRDVRRVRRVSGVAWAVTVVLAAPSGDLHVADVLVDEAGRMSPQLGADDVIEAVRRLERSSHLPSVSTELADFGDVEEHEDEPALAMLGEAEEPVDVRALAAAARNDRDSRLLSDHEGRGATLFTMAEVERKLDQLVLARSYLEAAAREFADRFDLASLERAAAFALELSGRDAFAGSPIQSLLEQSRSRLAPISSLLEARSFLNLPQPLCDALAGRAMLRTLAPGEMLVSEGDPARSVFVVKSGLLGVWLEKPSGGSWLVRCCFPGWLLGESSVLGSLDATCTASLRAERVSEVWVLQAAEVRSLMDADLSFGLRIAQTKQIHRIDSFFSMHETMGQLDVHVRDEMLSCIQRLESFEEETILLPANVVPSVACLVARGSIALFEARAGQPMAVVEADSFYGVRDAIHRVAPSVTAIARPHTTVALFDASRLRALCDRSTEQVVAVLERLG
jgi:CRP-like cAMP-binding protein